MEVLAIAGSIRPGSYNRALLVAAGRHLPAGVGLRWWDGMPDIPAYGEHLDGPFPPGPVRALRQAIGDADGLLIATPNTTPRCRAR